MSKTALTILSDALDDLRDIGDFDPVPITRYWLDADGALCQETTEYAASIELSEASATAGAALYAKIIRGIARHVWQGKPIDALQLLWDAVSVGLNDAWNQGARACGIAPDELTLDEQIRRNMLIVQQRQYIPGFLAWVNVHRRDGPDKKFWRQILPRTRSWANAWNRAYNEARARACGNEKLMWVLHGRHATKKPCDDCKKLNRRVYRASIWSKYNIYTQSPELACKGFNCGCAFRPAGPDANVTPGKPPRLAGQ